jgi:hypothetical protein
MLSNGKKIGKDLKNTQKECKNIKKIKYIIHNII